MGLELKPSILMSGLERASNHFESVEGTIKSLERSINSFVDNTQLDSPGYNGLKGNMSNGFIPMLDNASNAILDLLAANENHKSALEHVRRYPVLNQAQIDSEIEQLIRTISNLQNLPGMIPSVLIGPEERLNFLVQKSRDFQAYLSASSGIYSASASSLSQLDSALTTLELATFNVITGKWLLPPLSEVEMKILERDLELNKEKAMSYVMTDGEWDWDLIAMILDQPYNEITDAQWLALTYLLVEIDDKYLGNFLMLFAYQVDSPLGDSDSRELWEFCPGKLGTLKSLVDRMASINYDIQRMIWADSYIDNAVANQLQVHRNQLLQLSGLLQALGQTSSGIYVEAQESWSDCLFAGLLGDGSGTGPNIDVKKINGEFVVTYTQIFKVIRPIFHQESASYFYLPTMVSQKTITTVGPPLLPLAGNTELRSIVMGNILSNHAFVFDEVFANNIGIAIADSLVGMAIGGILMAGPYLGPAANFGVALHDTYEAQIANQNLLEDFNHIEEWWVTGCLLHFFQLTTVAISDNHGNLEHIPMETVNTIPALLAWNSYTGNNYSIDELREKLPTIMEEVSNMPSAEQQQLQETLNDILATEEWWKGL